MSPWVIVLIFLLLSAFFSGSEIAFVTSNKLKVELDRKQGRSSARLVAWLTDRPDYFIATMLVGNNISLVVYGLQMVIILDPLISRFIQPEIWVLVIQTIIATAIILLTAEFLPKTLFRLRPNKMINSLALPLLVFYVILYPITWISVSLSNILLKRIFHANNDRDNNNKVFGRVDLTHLVKQNLGGGGGGEDADMGHEMKLFQNALDFSKVRLRECMIPRTEIVSIDVNDQIDNLKQQFIETGYSRILVFEDHIDNIIGYAHHSDLFNKPDTIRSIVRPMAIVPESMPANKLLTQLLEEQKNAAIVVDEFGGTAGLVTTEDVLEEIFGEIEDEHDQVNWEEVVVNKNEFLFSGRHEIDYLNEKHLLNLPVSEEYETLAGLILSHHESIPRVGDLISIRQFEFRILKGSNTRIESVRLTVLQS
ncbi:MAG: hemolysin family protein [Bacteroidota bacterium]|nr:hemolysin family protein [Bacteroidota bacterium]